MFIALVKRLVWPALVLALVVMVGLPLLPDNAEAAKSAFAKVFRGIFWVGLGLSVAWLIVRLIEIIVWKLLERRVGTSIPRLLKDLVATAVFVVVGIVILKTVFDQSVTAIWATSGVVGIVLGFALQSMIADVFYGIALNVDQPFRIGQWVQINARGLEPMTGCVTEISWRSTRLRTIDNTLLVVPNSEISRMVLNNLSEPETKSRFEAIFTLEFGVPSERAVRVLEAGVKAAVGPLLEPRPKVLVHKVCERGVEYMVRYWLEPADVSPAKGRHAVTSSILRHLHQAGLTLAYEKQDVYFAKMPSRQLDRCADRSVIVKRIKIFSQLEAEEIIELAEKIKERRFELGQAVVTQGAAGDSMYALVEGLLEVRSDYENGNRQVKVSAIQPGEFFGEMSLLTGEPRSATVVAVTDAIVYEIGKDDLNALLVGRPQIAVQIAQIVAARRLELKAKEKLSPEDCVVLRQSVADQILEKMESVFSCLRDSLSFRGRVPVAPADISK